MRKDEINFVTFPSLFNTKPPFTQLNKIFTHIHDMLMFSMRAHPIVNAFY